ncbi:MAG TPA: 5-oxoprolinase subunit PxpA [Vicinamibacterales bacterium]|nr:5-oxoprolinase subunit PxpA [Vicinamibacterales bacterium]
MELPRPKIDLNADIGESSPNERTGNDERLLRTITSGNVACGFHAGDPSVMRHTVRAAVKAGVSIGAHPSFRDLEGFGRRELQIEPREIGDLVLYQIGALSAIARAENATLRHVKPHGALYNMSVKRVDIAEAIARAVASFDNTLRLVGLPGSELLAAGSRLGLSVAAEGFADRSYESDGSLTPRHVAGAVLTEPTHVAERAVRMVRQGHVVARDGTTLSMKVDTICVHGDTPGAAELAAAVRDGLECAGITVAAL